jgi:anti-sigma regulatory factor (Ser/Thr protein kinase)
MAHKELTCFNIKLQGHSSECNRIFNFIQDSLGHALFQGRVDEKFIHDLKLVTEEWFANIIKHGYADDEPGEIELELVAVKDGIRLTVTDSAPAYNPLEVDRNQRDQDFSEGGMGLILIKSLTDEQHYCRDGTHNVFNITKHYNSGR